MQCDTHTRSICDTVINILILGRIIPLCLSVTTVFNQLCFCYISFDRSDLIDTHSNYIYFIAYFMQETTRHHLDLINLIVLRVRRIDLEWDVWNIHCIEVVEYSIHHLLILHDIIKEVIGEFRYFKDSIEYRLLDIIEFNPIIDCRDGVIGIDFSICNIGQTSQV